MVAEKAGKKKRKTPAVKLPVPAGNPKSLFRKESKAARIARTTFIDAELQKLYANAVCELNFADPFQLLIAVILSAQTTDVMVNAVTPALFARFPDAQSLARADVAEVEHLVGKLGFFRQKAKAIVSTANSLMEKHAGQVPADMDALRELAGVGRKTANVVLGVAFGINVGIPVDTHVKRLTNRWGITTHDDPAAIEQDLLALVPQSDWRDFSLRTILHGRRVCAARRPKCEICTLASLCPSRTV